MALTKFMLMRLSGSEKCMKCDEMIKIALLHAVEILLVYTKSCVALRILGVAPTVCEKGVALKEGETLTPLHAPAHRLAVMSSV